MSESETSAGGSSIAEIVVGVDKLAWGRCRLYECVVFLRHQPLLSALRCVMGVSVPKGLCGLFARIMLVLAQTRGRPLVFGYGFDCRSDWCTDTCSKAELMEGRRA